MRFGIVAILGVTLLTAVAALALAIGGSLDRRDTSDIAGVPGSGQIFEIEVFPDNCLEMEITPGKPGRYCPDDFDGEPPSDLTAPVSRSTADSP